ncbi:MAG: hypothetical protein JKY50_22655 [Oleispira sp.]|nr:hypothetical protein [Oleispira sp.]
MKHLNTKLLNEKDACSDGFNAFEKAHGNKDVTWLKALESNGWYDIWWAISKFNNNLTDSQNKDLRLLAADYAEDCIHLFEKENTEDNRPRLAIEAARKFANGVITKEELADADAAAAAAADSADAAYAYADAAREKQVEQLKKVLVGWGGGR